MESRAWKVLPLVIALATAFVAGCSSKPEDKAAAPFVDALSSLGLSDVTYERAFTEPSVIRLVNARGTLDGKPVGIGEIQGYGFSVTGETWSAGRIVATRLEGDISAGEVFMVTPKGPVGRGKGGTSYDVLGGRDVKALVMGMPVRMARFNTIGTGNSKDVDIDGLRFEPASPEPTPILALARGAEWQVRAVAQRDARNGLVLEVGEIRSQRGILKGRLVLDGLGPDPVARLTGTDLNGLTSPVAWPGEVMLREARLSMTLAGPFPDSLGRVRPEDYADPYVKAIASAVSRMMGEGRVALDVVAMPRVGLPLRTLAATLAGKDAAAPLGLTARMEGVPPAPGMGSPASIPR